MGGKWDVLKNKLALTSAIYHTENENQFTQDPIAEESWIQKAKHVFQGVELGVVGQITDAWNISAGVAHMKTKQKSTSFNTTTGEKLSLIRYVGLRLDCFIMDNL